MLLFFPQLRVVPVRLRHKLLIITIIICAFVGVWQSNSILNGLIGFSTMPIGSLTVIAAIWVGWACARLLNIEKLCILLIVSALLSLTIALVLQTASLQASLNARLVGFHEHSLAWAMYIGVGSILTFWKFTKGEAHSWLFGIFSGIFLCAIGLSGSRVALITTALSLIAVMLIARKSKWPVAKQIVILALLLAFTIPFVTTPRLSNASYAAKSTSFRFELIMAGVRIIKDHPLGIGYGNIGRYTYSPNLPSDLLEPYHRMILIESSHNAWIDIVIGFGIVGGVIAVFLTFYVLKKAWIVNSQQQRILAVILTMILVNLLTTPASITTLVLLGIFVGVTTERI